ncbi:MAG TPA: biotin--[acetyl-CoA-carboxylase] ligase [Chloroflexota bacterium]|nr:biotin--[acetyl-CoA-carboxylase] ligase [Chloroflexota bacterium]
MAHSTLTPHSAALDWQRVAAALAGEPMDYQLMYLPVTGSTNDVARSLAAAGAPQGVVVFADAQTAGRGRPGKSPWLTLPNLSIAVSVVLRPSLDPAALPQVTMAAGVATVTAIRETTGVPAGLKWPNDVMVGTRKLGGILAESILGAKAIAYVVLGIGLNCNFPVQALGPLPDAAVPPTSLQEDCGAPISREALLIALLRRFGQVYGRLEAGEGDTVWQSYRAALGIVGRAVRIQTNTAPVDGTVEDVAADGALVLRLPSGERRTFTFGEVSLRF